MRMVTKINLTLAFVVCASALANFAALESTIMPRFYELEQAAAERNHSRVIEAIQGQKNVLASITGDWAFWDDTHAFVLGGQPDFLERNLDPASMQAINVNFMYATDRNNRIVFHIGFLFTEEGPEPLQLAGAQTLLSGPAFGRFFDHREARSGQIWTEHGMAVVGYAPILHSDRGGEPAGTLVVGRLLDYAALRSATKVDFTLTPVSDQERPDLGLETTADQIKIRSLLAGIDGRPVGVLTSTTSRAIANVGRQARWAAVTLLALAGVVLSITLAFVLRRMVIIRIEALRSHLREIASTGSMAMMPPDKKSDELSDTVDSFNHMAAQLNELRQKLRRQDYHHGAADHAAGVLHNVRNALSPIDAIAWDLCQSENAPWKGHLAKALEELDHGTLDQERLNKLHQFVALSAGKFLVESEKRKADLDTLTTMIRHVDGILKDEEAVSRGERSPEPIEITAAFAAAAQLISKRAHVRLSLDVPSGETVVGHRIVLEQVLANLLVNAAEAIEATERPEGTITVKTSPASLRELPAIDITISDDGDGIEPQDLERIFEKGFSTRRERSSGLGLHWCANVVNAMGGSLRAESRGKGCGAAFHLILARATSQLEQAA